MKIPVIPGFDPHAFEKYFKNTGWLMLGKVLSMVVGFLVASYLGPSKFGDLSFVEAMVLIISAVGALGLDSFIIREILNEPDKRDEILGTSFVLRVGISLLLIPLSVGIYLVFHHFSHSPGSSLTGIVALFALAYFFKAFNIIDSYFQSQVGSKYVVQVQNTCLFISLAAKLLLIFFNSLTVTFYAWSMVFDAVVLAAGLAFMYRKRGLHFAAWTFNRQRAISLLRQSWPLILTAVMVSVFMKIDIVMLKRNGSEQVGIYAAAAKISEAWYFIPVAIVTSVFPAIINARKTDLAKYQRHLCNLYDLLMLISLPVALVISFTADDIIQLLYKGSFAGAGAMLSIHIWSGIFVFLGSAGSQYLLAEGFTYISSIRTAIGAAVNIALNLWLIPLYGGIGASVATLIAYAIVALSVICFKSTRQQGILILRSLFLISLFEKLIFLRRNK